MFTDGDGIDITFEVTPAGDNKPGYDVTLFYADRITPKSEFASRKHMEHESAATLLQPDLHAKLKYQKGKPWSNTMAMLPDGQVNQVLAQVIASVVAQIRKLREGAIAAGGGNVQSASAPTL